MLWYLERKNKLTDTQIVEALHTLRPAAEWHEDYGSVLWWHLPICEPPLVGTDGGVLER